MKDNTKDREPHDINNSMSIFFGYLFKMVIIIIGIGFLILLHYYSLNGRYNAIDKDLFTILDTRTGIIYLNDIEHNQTIILDQINGVVNRVPLDIKTSEDLKIKKKK